MLLTSDVLSAWRKDSHGEKDENLDKTSQHLNHQHDESFVFRNFIFDSNQTSTSWSQVCPVSHQYVEFKIHSKGSSTASNVCRMRVHGRLLEESWMTQLYLFLVIIRVWKIYLFDVNGTVCYHFAAPFYISPTFSFLFTPGKYFIVRSQVTRAEKGFSRLTRTRVWGDKEKSKSPTSWFVSSRLLKILSVVLETIFHSEPHKSCWRHAKINNWTRHK